MTSSIIWDKTPCSPLKANRRFGSTCRLRLQGRRKKRARNQNCLLPASLSFLAWLICWPWGWRRYVPPKRRVTFNGLYGAISHKIEVFLNFLLIVNLLFTKIPNSNFFKKNSAMSLIIYKFFQRNIRKTMFRGAVLIGNFSDRRVKRIDVTMVFKGCTLSWYTRILIQQPCEHQDNNNKVQWLLRVYLPVGWRSKNFTFLHGVYSCVSFDSQNK
jgi:hypothetical protein